MSAVTTRDGIQLPVGVVALKIDDQATSEREVRDESDQSGLANP